MTHPQQETLVYSRHFVPTLVGALLLVACAGSQGEPQAEANAARAEPEAKAQPIAVQTEAVATVDAPIMLRLTGSLKGRAEAELAANAAGRVVRTKVERGDHVKAGQVIAQLDVSQASLSLAEAKVRVQTSQTQEGINEADCARYEQLKAKGAVSALEYDQATAKCKTAPLNLQLAEAQEQLAAKNVGDGTIRAPFAGIVTERFIEVGEYVQPSSRVASLIEDGQLRLEFTVPEAYLAQVNAGADVRFRVAAYPDQTFSAKVKFVSGAVRPQTRDLVVEAVVDEAEELRSGMFADVMLEVGKERHAAVPVAAVFERQEKKRVFVVVDGRLQERVIQYGPTVGEKLSVKSGVTEGEQVAIGDLDQLKNGATVR